MFTRQKLCAKPILPESWTVSGDDSAGEDVPRLTTIRCQIETSLDTILYGRSISPKRGNNRGRPVWSAKGFPGGRACDRRLGDSLPISKAFLSSGEIAAVYETIRCEVDSPVGLVTIARPKALNAVSMKAMEEIVHASHWLDGMDSVKAIIITGEGNKAFAAGADIKEMASQTYSEAYKRRFMEGWKDMRDVRKPIIAAVNGYALGGGCEVAMMADIIIASDNASFGQPEVTLGVIPGMGGTQRLIREVGKSKAMEMILCGTRLTAAEAERAGLVSRVVPQDQLLPEAYKLAAKIGGLSTIAVAKAKDCVHRAYEMSLGEGLRYEQREFWSSFGLEDQKEGMRAFLEKREPHFTNS